MLSAPQRTPRAQRTAGAGHRRRARAAARARGAPAPTGHDPGLVEEVRQLVVARNERRARQGLEPLDVEAEIARTLEELDP